MFLKHPDIAKRWTKNYKQNLKRLPRKKKRVSEFVFGQPGHPSPAAPFSSTPSLVSPAAMAAAAIPTPRNRRLRLSKMKTMARLAKKVKHRLRQMGYLKNEATV